MGINKLIDKLNDELDKLNNSNNIDTNSFFTNNEKFNDELNLNDIEKNNNDGNQEFYEEKFEGKFQLDLNEYEDIEPDDKTKDLVSIKEKRLLAAQTMFKKSIKISLKSFLISLSLSFLNLFI